MKQSTLGSLIRALRIQNQMTQAQLGEKLNVTDKAVSKWERGLSYPDIALFPGLADTLGVSVSDLLKECVDEDQPSRLLQIFEMSHDLRTPLHIILGCAELAENHSDDKQLLTRYLNSIRISGDYLLRAINRAMLVTGRDPMSDTENETSDETADLESSLRKSADRKNHSADTANAREQWLREYDFSGKRILVAEDMELNREIIREFLKQTGVSMDFAEDGQVCLDRVLAAPAGYYDLILMDVMMPNMDGIEATRRIRGLSDPGKASIPIIAVTANVYEKDKNIAMEAGMDAFTEKPIFVERLFDKMKMFLQKKA
ncbi:MAG: response regulator [Lachnospiraceae bacterium]|nr:response regulator [Lachnospiraceae bacterium]